MHRVAFVPVFLPAVFAIALAGACSDAPPTAPDAVASRVPERFGDPARETPAVHTPVEIHNVYSGPPARPGGTINLGDQFVFAEILNIEAFIPRPASPADVRIGDGWETGTPAQGLELLDINQDGNRDIRLRFSISQLVTNGHLNAQTTQLVVWGRDPTSLQLYRGEAAVTVQPPPGGVLYALSYSGQAPNGVQRVIRIDTSTGAASAVATVPGVHSVVVESSAFDPATGRYFFAGGGWMGVNIMRWSVNVHTGDIHNFGPAIAFPDGNEGGWEFDPTSGMIYARSYDLPNQLQRVIRIDPGSGAVSVVAIVPGVQSVVIGSSAFDPATGRYFFAGGPGMGDNTMRWSVNVHTGEIHSFGPTLTPPDGTEGGWEFDAVTGMLHALSYAGPWPNGVQRIIRIDTATGAVAVAATVPGVHSVRLGAAAFDPITRRYFFAGGPGMGENTTRWSVNVHTGEIHNFGPVISPPEGNEGGWEFDG